LLGIAALLKAGAAIDSMDENQETALMLAARNGYTDVVQVQKTHNSPRRHALVVLLHFNSVAAKRLQTTFWSLRPDEQGITLGSNQLTRGVL
jgi:ankyrin repeat protein